MKYSRPYQSALLVAVRASWESFSKCLIISATGTGKTICFCLMALEYATRGERTLIVVDQDELVTQAIDKLLATTGIVAGREQGPYRASLTDMVVVTTRQSMERRLDQWPKDHFALAIVDEADRSLSASWQNVLRHFDGNANVAGFTATAIRSDQRSLGDYYENIPFEATLFDFIGEGKWAFDETSDPAIAAQWRAQGLEVEVMP